jgi:Zn-dependent protease
VPGGPPRLPPGAAPYPGSPPAGAPDYPPPNNYPPPGYPPPNNYPPPGYPPPNNYPPPGYPPPGYPPPGYPPPGGPPRQHAWQTPNGRPPPRPGPGPPHPPSNQRMLVWVIVAVALGAILVRAHRITSTDVIFFCVLIPSVILHEIAHGVVALAFGDDTAKRAGRLTLNPLRHVTLFGTIIVPFITILSGLGFFGWAKPVPVNVARLRSPRNHGFLVALAGPLTNVVLAAVLGVIFYFAFAVGRPYVPTTLAARIVFDAGVVNIWVACFNMIPIPPLDGSALVERLLPAAWWPGYLRIRPYGMIVIFGALLLFSFTGRSPIGNVFDDIATWWGHLIHAFSGS